MSLLQICSFAHCCLQAVRAVLRLFMYNKQPLHPITAACRCSISGYSLCTFCSRAGVRKMSQEALSIPSLFRCLLSPELPAESFPCCFYESLFCPSPFPPVSADLWHPASLSVLTVLLSVPLCRKCASLLWAQPSCWWLAVGGVWPWLLSALCYFQW